MPTLVHVLQDVADATASACIRLNAECKHLCPLQPDAAQKAGQIKLIAPHTGSVFLSNGQRRHKMNPCMCDAQACTRLPGLVPRADTPARHSIQED